MSSGSLAVSGTLTLIVLSVLAITARKNAELILKVDKERDTRLQEAGEMYKHVEEFYMRKDATNARFDSLDKAASSTADILEDIKCLVASSGEVSHRHDMRIQALELSKRELGKGG